MFHQCGEGRAEINGDSIPIGVAIATVRKFLMVWDEKVVSQNVAIWKQIAEWLRRIDRLHAAA